jgi:hypothetical protein
VVFPDGNLLEPAFNQGFVEGFKVGTLLLNVILQVINSCNLHVSGSGVNGAFFTLFAKLENLVSNLIVGFFVVSFFEKLFLKLHQMLVNAISGALLSFSDDFSNVLL